MDILAAFVAINTLMYVCLAFVKLLPRVRLPKVLRRRYSRAESRSIHPKTPEAYHLTGRSEHQDERHSKTASPFSVITGETA